MPDAAKPADPSGGASRDSVRNTLLVALSVSLACSILVASFAIALKPRQDRNEKEYRQRIILEAAGLMYPGADIDQLSGKIEARMVELASGKYIDSPAPDDFDAEAAAKSTELGVSIPPDLDIAGIHRRAIFAPVYLVWQDEEISQVILPVYGSGLWSTIRGYLALATDGTTVEGLRFYSHGETPGLGDQIEDPEWLQQWQGKAINGPGGEPRIEVIRGTVKADAGAEPAAAARFQVDGLSGATLTGRGVTRLIRYWTGAHGFGPYLEENWPSDGAER